MMTERLKELEANRTRTKEFLLENTILATIKIIMPDIEDDETNGFCSEEKLNS